MCRTGIWQSEGNSRFLPECVRYCRRLVLGHAPLNAVRLVSETRHGRALLTVAIQRMLPKVNSRRDLTHPQLLFLFSNILNYAKVFVQTNEIDCQMRVVWSQSLLASLSLFVLAIRATTLPGSPFFFVLLPQALSLRRPQDASYGRLVDG
jgi:hypothetical protein